MTNPTPHGQVPESLIDLIDAYAETRHRCGGIYNAKTEAARKAVIEALSGVQALSAAPAGFVPVAAFDRLHAHAESLAARLLAASPTPTAEQQAAPKAAAGEPTPELQRMTESRAAFFMERFLREEKLLGPNERAAVQFALNMLEAQERMTALHKPAVDKAWGQFQSAMAAPQQEAQEPVAWQSRTRPTWGGDNRPWSPWEPCTKGQAEDCWKTPLLHEWAYEARALYAAPQPSPAAQGDAQDAARYRLVRRGQHWSLIDGIGNALRAEELDAAVDAARAAQEGKSNDR